MWRGSPNMGSNGDRNRAASHLGASTSAPIFRESLIQDNNSNDLTNTTRSHWWARRSHPQSVHGQTSFFEPPDFNQQRAYNYYDKFSERVRGSRSGTTTSLERSSQIISYTTHR
ncbi:hypothetical protein SESBI_41676 [Sesbania bispinosa]|nr:hypothetical protein SESBI_41676 [Sesbania bispinosa]